VAEMTSHERFRRTFEHQEADRVPIIDSPWPATIERWQREGMPAGMSFVDFFGLDHVGHISVDNSPRYEVKTLEETDEYSVWTSAWGATLKTWKHAASTPEFRAFTIVDRPSWEAAKKRMTPTRDRVNWDRLKADFPAWRQKGRWIEAGLWFGFDVTHAWAVGTERLLMALVEQPDWCVDMFNTYLDLDLAMFDMVWDAGYHFDEINWPDDLGYKHNQFMSLAMYRELLKPVHKRACDWAHAKGVKVRLHSCGDVNPFVPEFIEIGIDALNPLEVKAGMDPVALKRKFGPKLVLNGGINAVYWDDFDAISAQMRQTIPVVKENGGYIFSSDHSVPSTVSLENFRRITDLAKELGTY
jgi:uroporphyrinogen decarboxylase